MAVCCFCFKYYRFWTDAGRKYFDLSDFLLPVDLCSFCTGDTVRQERLLLDDPDLCFYVVTESAAGEWHQQKTVATILGCIGGLVIAALISASCRQFLQLTGLVDEDSMYLLFLNPADPVDLKAIIFSAIIIGALGAIMDVAMDIASALNELAATTAEPTRKMLLQAGNNIGRDILGMMSNTLILAYIGGSLTIVLLFFAYNHSLLYLLNKEMVVVEILQAVIGSFGILFTIPFTSFICSRLYVKKAGRRYKSGLEK